jgi:hypothetical protein
MAFIRLSTLSDISVGSGLTTGQLRGSEWTAMRRSIASSFLLFAMSWSLATSIALRASALEVEIGLNFSATTSFESDFIPPDSMAAVGEAHIVELINGSYKIFRKSDGATLEADTLDGFWISSGAAPDNFTFDPRVLYDPDSRRWFAAAVDGLLTLENSNNLLLAVSNSSDPTLGWSGFKIPSSTGRQFWADFPASGSTGLGSSWLRP